MAKRVWKQVKGTYKRFYDPSIGRFITADPYWNIDNMQRDLFAIRESSNLYVYTMNNPIMFIDPWGLNSWIFYDPNIHTGVGSPDAGRLIAERMRDDLRAEFGDDHLVFLIAISDGDHLVRAWNGMVTISNALFGGEIDTVTLLFHMNPTAIGMRTSEGRSVGEERRFNLDSDLSRLNNNINIGVIYLAGCQAAPVGNTNSLANRFTQRFDPHVLIASEFNQAFTAGGRLILPNYLGVSPNVENPLGLRVFWQGVGSPPRIGTRYASMGALIRSARRARANHPNG